jgi:hypothetical protein
MTITFLLPLGKAYFHKIKVRETLSRSQSDLTTTDGNRASPHQLSCVMYMQEFKIFVLKFYLLFLIMQIRQAYCVVIKP